MDRPAYHVTVLMIVAGMEVLGGGTWQSQQDNALIFVVVPFKPRAGRAEGMGSMSLKQRPDSQYPRAHEKVQVPQPPVNSSLPRRMLETREYPEVPPEPGIASLR